MSSGNELTPQQEFDSVLSKAAVDIARMEQVRDDPGRPASPAPAPKPPGTPPTGGGRPPVDKDFQNNAIADKKAETLKKIGEISNKVPADQKKEMQDKAYATLYPGDKKDLNQIPANKNARDEKGNRLGDKEIDNAQERANALKGKSADKDKDKGKDQDKGDKEISKSQDKMEALKSNANAQKKEANKAEKPQAKSSMSKQFTQPLQQGKNVQNPSQSKSQSMGARFTQSMNHSKSSPSPSTKSSPGKSSPGGRGSSGGGSRGGGGGRGSRS